MCAQTQGSLGDPAENVFQERKYPYNESVVKIPHKPIGYFKSSAKYLVVSQSFTM